MNRRVVSGSPTVSALPTLPALPPLPALVDGTVSHTRKGPLRHDFRHRAYQWLVDLADIPEQSWYLKGFASFHAEDHIGDPDRPIKANIETYLAANGIDLGPRGRILMLANARVLGHVFDPLTVFWCFDTAGMLSCVLAEVHNTYGERHAYLLHPDTGGTAHTAKALYVSPFYDVSGDYALRFTLTPDHVAVTVTLRRGGQTSFSATFSGRPRPATRRSLAAMLIRRPLMPQRVSALIRIHAIWLWLRRLPVAPRPQHAPQEGVR